ncbi:calmodulin-binding protein 60 B [Ricinus communis]|uniref:calmodulin-binding protein 60 B n=1 Tax=Ricinus communis TaxID=3988 RepID=UPI0007728405|nr:calmodulin-binding protein 60 B [Ricinus communis]|eukprot:XP_015570434.1 calmodulin-binding protein 60 G [Ricinus communis]
MVTKRYLYGDAESGTEEASAHDSKRFKNVIRDVLGMLSVEDMAAKMEPFLRRVVRDEVERTVCRILHPSFRPPFNQNETTGGRGFLLRFVNKPPSTIFTNSRIEAEDGSPIRIELWDANRKTLVTSGPLSCMKIEILVLNGDFGLDDLEDWSETEFNASVIREREGRRPLVTGGDLNVTLRGGVVSISDVAFTDNSSWQRSRKFRLGAKPVSKISGESGEARIREARSEAFVVKDHRGELYKKHYPPQLDDEVWRLERIAKDGSSHKKLAELGIRTVRDFLQRYAVNPPELRRVLGGGISNKIWDTIIEHANTCVLDEKLYAYFEPEQSVGLIFDSVYKIIKVTFDGQTYEPLDKLTPPHKALVENLKRQAYNNVKEFILIDAHAISGPSRTLTCPGSDSYHDQNLGLQQPDLPVARKDEPEMLIDFNTAGSANHLFQSPLRNSFKLGDLFLPCTGESTWQTSVSQWHIPTNQLTPEEILQPQTSNWSAGNSPGCSWGQGDTFIFSSGNEELGFISAHPRFSVHMSRIRKPKAGWCKLRAAIMKWGSVRRDIAAKRMWQSFCHVDYQTC